MLILFNFLDYKLINKDLYYKFIQSCRDVIIKPVAFVVYLAILRSNYLYVIILLLFTA